MVTVSSALRHLDNNNTRPPLPSPIPSKLFTCFRLGLKGGLLALAYPLPLHTVLIVVYVSCFSVYGPVFTYPLAECARAHRAPCLLMN
jgi:hypothetical protein